MDRALIGAAFHVEVRPEDRVTGSPAVADANAGEVGFAAFELLVQINEECRDPLSADAQLIMVFGIRGIEKVVVELELLPDGILQNLGRFEHRHRDMYRGGNPRSDDFQHHIHVQHQKFRAAVGPPRIDAVRAGRVEHHGAAEAAPGAFDEPAAFGRRGEPLDHANGRRTRQSDAASRLHQPVERNGVPPLAPEVSSRIGGQNRIATVVGEKQQLPSGTGRTLPGCGQELVECAIPALRARDAHGFEQREHFGGGGEAGDRGCLDQRDRPVEMTVGFAARQQLNA